MNKEQAKRFVETYSKYYFENKVENIEKMSDLGIPDSIHTTVRKYEDDVMKCLENGELTFEVVGWKIGKQSEYKTISDDVCYLPTAHGQKSIEKEALCDYLKYFTANICDIESSIIKGLAKLKHDSIIKFAELFGIIKKGAPKNFGTVYIINLLFFKSKGAFPIYDRFAHTAAKALYMNLSPKDVFVGCAADKTSNNQVASMYAEYVFYLSKVFPDMINENGDEMFISRELDRALWVYGHASKRYEGNVDCCNGIIG